MAANPLFFYAFEFWEHTVAVALLAGSAVAGGSDDRRRQFASGLLTGLAVLLRPEAIWWAAMWMLTTPAARAAFVTGLAVVGGAFVSVNVVEGAPPLGFHTAANVGVMGDAWLATRLRRFEVWLLPLSPWFIAALAAGVAAWLLRQAGHTERARHAGLAAALLVAAGSVAGAYVQDSLWWAFPLGGLLLNSAAYQERRDAILVWGTASVVLLTSTHDGGAQWGPRILLIMTPALLLCTAAALSAAATPGRARLPRLVIVGLLVSCGLWTSRHAYLELRGWKRYYGTLAQSLERESTAGGYIVTNVWWLDQIGATLAPSRTFLVASTPEQMTALLNRLREANVGRFQLAWSEEPGEGNAPAVDQSCFRIASRRRLAERSLTIATAEVWRTVDAWRRHSARAPDQLPLRHAWYRCHAAPWCNCHRAGGIGQRRGRMLRSGVSGCDLLAKRRARAVGWAVGWRVTGARRVGGRARSAFDASAGPGGLSRDGTRRVPSGPLAARARRSRPAADDGPERSSAANGAAAPRHPLTRLTAHRCYTPRRWRPP